MNNNLFRISTQSVCWLQGDGITDMTMAQCPRLLAIFLSVCVNCSTVLAVYVNTQPSLCHDVPLIHLQHIGAI